MNGHQIENVLRLIDGNIELTRGEVAQYIRDNQQSVAESLVRFGSATIPITAGKLRIVLQDLETTAA